MKNQSAEMLRKKLEDQKRYQSPQGFTAPRPSRCEEYYGKEYEEPEADDTPWWFRCLIVAAIAGVLVLCMALYPKSNSEVKSEQVQSQAN